MVHPGTSECGYAKNTIKGFNPLNTRDNYGRSS